MNTAATWIIVDHHLVPPIPPAAYAIIDPKAKGSRILLKLYAPQE